MEEALPGYRKFNLYIFESEYMLSVLKEVHNNKDLNMWHVLKRFRPVMSVENFETHEFTLNLKIKF